MGVAMSQLDEGVHRAVLPDVVALLIDTPGQQMTRGQVGTVVEPLTDATVLVDFSDDRGQTYAIVPCPVKDLLALRYIREAA